MAEEIRLKDFLNRYGGILKKKALSKFDPIYSPSQKTHTWIREAEEKLNQLKRKPFPTQRDAILALAKGFREGRKGLIAVGEMGVGKTIIAIAVSYLIPKERYRVIVMCPPHLVQKWIREIKETIPHAKVFNLNGAGLGELERLRNAGPPAGREYYIIGRERAKLNYSVKKACWEQKHLNRQICPRCGAGAGEDEVDEKFNKTLETKKRPKCPRCGEPLYEASSRFRRFAKAEYMKKYLRGKFDLFIVDEVHELKGGATAQGQALADLASISKNALALTGTLMGGYATNLFYIMWRLMPKKMLKKKLPYSSPRVFAEYYGVVEETVVEKKEEEYGKASIGRAGRRTYVKEKPGISPLVLSDFLLENCVFMRLSDVSSELPPYEEEVVEVEMMADQKEAYKQLASDLYDAVREALAYGSQRLLGAFVNSLLAYPDGARRGEIVVDPADGESEIASAPPIEAELLPKEERLLEILEKEISEGRKCLLYLEHTGTRDLTPILKEILQKAGIRAFVLKAETVKPEKREAHVKKLAPLYDVMICNPRIVQTGLDLVEFPTVIFFQTGYSIFTLRQASRRSWRIGQKEPVRVYYLCYSETMQERALSLMAEKLETALAVEGELSDKGLVAISESANSMLYELARTLVGEKKTKGVGDAWKDYRKKELEADSLLGAEEAEVETSTTTITKGERTATVKWTKVVRGKIFPQKGYGVCFLANGKRLFLKQGLIYYNKKVVGKYDRKGSGKVQDKFIRIVRSKDSKCYYLVELKPIEPAKEKAA